MKPKTWSKGWSKPAHPRKKAAEDEAYFLDLADKTSSVLGAKVRLKKSGKRGRIEISFTSNQDLERLLKILGVEGF